MSSTGGGTWLQSLDRDSQAAADLMRSSTAMQAQWDAVVDIIGKCSRRLFVSGLGEHYINLWLDVFCLLQASQVMLLTDWRHR